jgi:hypothetical protein
MKKALVKRMSSPRPTLPIVRRHRASLQRPTPVKKKPKNIQTEEEIRTLITEKLIVLISFP